MAIFDSGYRIATEWVDETNNTPVTVRKQVWNPDLQQFEPRVFTRYQISQSQLDQDLPWLTKSLGKSGPGCVWWYQKVTRTSCYLWLSDSAATFWRLKSRDC